MSSEPTSPEVVAGPVAEAGQPATGQTAATTRASADGDGDGDGEVDVEPPQLLAQGHLHPGMLFLRVVDGLRGALVPALLAVVTQQLWIAIVTLLLFLVSMLVAVVRFLTFQYRLSTDELVTTEGVLHRQERRIPVDRIQDLSFEQSLLRRLVGLVVVSVETASGHGSEAKLDSLSRHQAELLRTALQQVRASGAGSVAGSVAGMVGVGASALATSDAAATEPPEIELFRTSGAELTLLGLTNNRIGAILLALLGLWQLSADFGMERFVGDVFGGVAGKLARFGPLAVAVLAAALLFMALLAGWAASVVASWLMFYDFRLLLRGDVLQRRYGLLTTRARTLRRRRIQRVLLEQTFVRRCLAMATLRADSAGSSMDPRLEARGGLDVVVPLAPLPRVRAVVPWLLWGIDLSALEWRAVSPRMVLRVFVKGLLLTALVMAATWPLLGPAAASFTILLPIAWLVGHLSYRNMGWALLPHHLAMRWGVLGRYSALIPLRKVQGAVTEANPLDRRLGLARLTVFVAGGSPTTVRNLVRQDAQSIMLEIVRRAAHAGAGW